MERQVHVYYSGSVQGVGFRYTAIHLAQDMEISGWVKNLSDGRVEVLAEAQDDILESFLDKIKNSFSSHIRDIQIDWQSAKGEFSDFTIKF